MIDAPTTVLLCIKTFAGLTTSPITMERQCNGSIKLNHLANENNFVKFVDDSVLFHQLQGV